MIAFFVSATDTDVGKTYISKGLRDEFSAQGKKVGYFKPFQSGVVGGEPTDAQIVCGHTLNSYVTKTPCAPSLSAKLEKVTIDLLKVKEDFEQFKKGLDVLIVEGSGGLFVPVTENKLMTDVIKMLDLPVLLVARPNLGTVNHTLMSLKCLDVLDIKTLGVVISNYDETSNDPSILNAKNMIENHSTHKVLEQVKKGQKDFSDLTRHLAEVLQQQKA